MRVASRLFRTDDQSFLGVFESHPISRADWTHRAQVTVASLYLRQSRLPIAIEKVRVGV